MTSHENNEAGDVRGLSDEQRAELRRLLDEGTPGPWEVMAYDSGLSYRELNVSVITEKHGDRIADCDYDTDRDGPQVAEGADAYLIVAAVNALPELLDEVDTLRERLAEAEAALEAGDACGAVGCRAMERLAKVEALLPSPYGGGGSMRAQIDPSALRAALSAERGEGRG